jgi:DDE superfamily endonuclease
MRMSIARWRCDGKLANVLRDKAAANGGSIEDRIGDLWRWWMTCGLVADVDPALGQEIFDVSKRQRVSRVHRHHLDEVFAKVNGKLRYLWRAVYHEGEVLEAVVTSKRNKAAALKLLKRIMKK